MKSIQINREVYTNNLLDSLYPYEERSGRSISRKIRKLCRCSKEKLLNGLVSFFPIVKVVSTYKKTHIAGDLIAGLTVSFMHLPQGLAFSVLAGLPAVYGLYTTFFPLLFYMVFGASPYVAFATNAVTALLVQKIVKSESEFFMASLSSARANSTITLSGWNNQSYLNGSTSDFQSAEEILNNKVLTASTASFVVGLILATLGLLRCGFLMTYMSESFIGGFTTAAGIHIISSQVPKMFGIKVCAHTGAGKLIKMYIELFSKVGETVVSEIVITVICIVIILFVKVCINEKFKTRLKVPIPIDLLVVVIATVISHFSNFENNLDVTVIGDIPSGFLQPISPALEITPRIIIDCFVIAVLTLMMTISLAKLTAKLHDQQINDNQEMIAYGVTNVLSSFFSCFPQSATPSRTMLDSDLGANTTLNSLPTVVFMLLVILWIGPLFHSLPMSVLAAMITVAMKNLILQFGDLIKIWRVNKFDFLIWIVSCFVSVFVNLDYGIIAGIGCSILSVVLQHQFSEGTLIGRAGDEHVYLDCENRVNVFDNKHVKIFQFQAPLYFANCEVFKTKLNQKIVDPHQLNKTPKRRPASMRNENGDTLEGDQLSHDVEHSIRRKFVTNVVQYIVIDCQMISYIDITGISMLTQVIKEYRAVGIEIILVKCPKKLLETLNASDFFKILPTDLIFYDITDAFYFIENRTDLEMQDEHV